MNEAQFIMQSAVGYLGYVAPVIGVLAIVAFADVIFSFILWIVLQTRKGHIKVRW